MPWRISTSRAVTPSCRIKAQALPRVRLLVPKPGIVKAPMRWRGTAKASIVLQVTSRDSVESSPPEMPMDTGGLPMCSSRLASPATCV